MQLFSMPGLQFVYTEGALHLRQIPTLGQNDLRTAGAGEVPPKANQSLGLQHSADAPWFESDCLTVIGRARHH